MFLILGKTGQLGRALVELLDNQAHAVDRDEVDMANPSFISMLERFTGGRMYTSVINAAAYTQVDKAEGEGKTEAYRVNAEAVGELADWCKARGMPLVHISTDYVFDGSGSVPHKETDTPHPLNAYGASKLEGERRLAASGARYLLFRTSWVYDDQGKNFFTTMMRLFHEKDSLQVVGDQIGAPTYALHLAQAILQALAKPNWQPGLYHLTGRGETSWHGFAQAIFALATKDKSGQQSHVRCQRIEKIPTSAYPTPAKRPLNSRLDCQKAKSVLGVALDAWETGLAECYARFIMRTGRA